MNDHSDPVIWNGNDYQSNSDYYQSLENTNNFHLADNLRLDKLSSPRFHPINGKSIIYLRQQSHMLDLRQSTTTLHWFDLETNKTVQLTRPRWGIHDREFYWINNDIILFLSNRASSGLNQIFQLKLPINLLKMVTTFIEPIHITNYSLNIDNLLVNRQASRLAFSCQVYPNLTIEQTFVRHKTEKDSGRSMYQFDKLFIRNLDKYMTGRRHHPFVVPIEQQANGTFKFSSDPVDLLFNVDSDSPPRLSGYVKKQWSFSATGNSFAYTRRYDETSAVAWASNLDIYTVDLNVLRQESMCITCDNLSIDINPSYSPTDDHVLIYQSQSKLDDHLKIKWYNRSNSKRITILDNWDRNIDDVTWSSDGQSIFLELGEEARHVIYYLGNLFNEQSLIRLLRNGTSRNIDVHPINSRMFVFTHESFLEPANIYLYSSNESIRSLTQHNKVLLSKVRMSTKVEKFSFIGARNETVWGWYMTPVDGRSTPAPLAFLIHGGPQDSWYDMWADRWNFQIYASQGYAVIAINFHGSVSYGQNFTNSVIGEFGSLPFEDLKLGLNYAFKKFPNIDSNRAVALGHSYGGYMVYWIAGQSEMNRRFKTFISYNGIFDIRALSYSTDELSLIDYYFGTYTSWANPDTYERFNPINHIANWSQPMLISVGAHDYRVPEIQGIGAFTALQRCGIESRLLYFSMEGHSISNALNSIAWYEQVLDWMHKWTS